MACKVKSLMLLAAVLLAFANMQAINATVTVTSNFDTYSSVLPKLTSVNDRLRLLRAVWGELRADDDGDIVRVKNFYDNILNNTNTATIAAEAEEAAELAAEVRQVLVNVNGRLLAETLNNNDSQKIVSVQAFRTQLLSKYSLELLNAIFEQAIDAAYPYISTDLLHYELNTIDLYTTTALTYQLRVNWNLYLYRKFLQRGDINDKYVYEAAMALRNLKTLTFYSSLSNEQVRRIDAAFTTFPSSLRVLFNSTAVCLENVNMANYFLYYAESTASTASSYVPAVIRNRFESKSNERLVWTNSFADRWSSTSTYLSLKAKYNDWYLYRQQTGSSPVLVQRSDTVSSLRNWTPSLVNKHIMFQQLNFYMCGTTQFDATLLGFAVKSVPDIKLDDSNCQWILTDCSKY